MDQTQFEERFSSLENSVEQTVKMQQTLVENQNTLVERLNESTPDDPNSEDEPTVEERTAQTVIKQLTEMGVIDTSDDGPDGGSEDEDGPSVEERTADVVMERLEAAGVIDPDADPDADGPTVEDLQKALSDVSETQEEANKALAAIAEQTNAIAKADGGSNQFDDGLFESTEPTGEEKQKSAKEAFLGV